MNMLYTTEEDQYNNNGKDSIYDDDDIANKVLHDLSMMS